LNPTQFISQLPNNRSRRACTSRYPPETPLPARPCAPGRIDRQPAFGLDFYIICPDNDVTRDVDNRRILWAAEDIIRNRPAQSRWHPDYADEFAAFLTQEAPFRR
jgi:hypothetical protein